MRPGAGTPLYPQCLAQCLAFCRYVIYSTNSIGCHYLSGTLLSADIHKSMAGQEALVLDYNFLQKLQYTGYILSLVWGGQLSP